MFHAHTHKYEPYINSIGVVVVIILFAYLACQITHGFGMDNYCHFYYINVLYR